MRCISLAVLCISFFCACSSVPTAEKSNDFTSGNERHVDSVLQNIVHTSAVNFTKPTSYVSDTEIFELSEEQKQHFLAYYHAAENIELEGHIKLHKYLQNFGDNFSYSDYTNTAIETYQSESGNCMSLAVLTTAYANLVGLNVKYQLVKRVPIYQKFGSVIFNAEHVRTVVTESAVSAKDGFFTIPGYSVIDYYPSRYSVVKGYISEGEFLGRYYRNLAAEALGENDLDRGFWLAKYSLEKQADNADAINTLAIANRRLGNFEAAEKLFKYGLENFENKLILLRNYRILLEQQGRDSEAELIAEELNNYTVKNPFDILAVAETAFAEKKYFEAMGLYKEVISLAPYLHQAYFGLAKLEYKRGNLRAANEALQRALQESYNDNERTVYAAKLAVLKNQRSQ